MGNALSSLPCAQPAERPPRWSFASREIWLEQRCAELATQNEQLRQRLRELEQQQTVNRDKRNFATGMPVATKAPSLNRLPLADWDASSKNHVSSTDLATMAIAAAAESTAEYQRSMVKVSIDNDSLPSSTVVTVRAPNRRGLLADMSSALAGLGLIVSEASSTISGGSAANRFVLQEADTSRAVATGRKVSEKERLWAIEQRLQQRFCGTAVRGVQRLMVERFIRAEPPWEHVALEPVEPSAAEERVWLAMLALVLRGGSSLGIVGDTVASKLAAELVGELVRMRVTSSITSEATAGEWLLLLEEKMQCRIASSDGRLSSSSGGSPPQSIRRHRRMEMMVNKRASDNDDSHKLRWLKPGTVLWEFAHEPSDLPSRDSPLKWSELVVGAAEGVLVRAVHLSSVRSRLVELKENLAREHAQVLADTPVFAPLSTSDLLELCRRATQVDISPGTLVLAGEDSTVDDDCPVPDHIAEVLNASTFGLLLSGELQICLRLDPSHLPDSELPRILPLCRLKPHDTFGEKIPSVTKGVSYRSERGATLLCWQRDPVLTDTLTQLVGDSRDATPRPSLLEMCWISRSPLSVIVDEPRLLQQLMPMSVPTMRERYHSEDYEPSEDTTKSVLLVLEGEMKRHPHRDTLLKVHFPEAGNPSPPDSGGELRLAVSSDMPSRCHSFREWVQKLSELGYQVSDTTFSLESGRAHDAFYITLPAGDMRPDAVRREELATKIQALQDVQMFTGDAIQLLATDGLSRVPRLSCSTQPSRVAVIDLKRFSEAILELGGDLAQLWFKFIDCHEPSLLSSEMRRQCTAGEKTDTSEEVMYDEVAAGRSLVWWDLLCKFNLFRLRQTVGEPEVGVVLSDLELGLKLGEGGYGVVHLARHKVSGQLFAVKSFSKAKIRRIEEKNTYMRLERERKTLKLLAAEALGYGGLSNLSKLICSGQDMEWLYLVMPACLGGDLHMLLDQVGRLSDSVVQFYAGCIVLGLQHLHSLNIAYRDLKPENVLLYSNGWPILTDFGLVAFLDDGPAMSMVGTTEFMAPEVIVGSGHNTDADYWSLGVLVSELLTLGTPFLENAGEGNQKTYSNILQGKYSRQWGQKEYRKLHTRTASVIDSLLQVDPASRLGATRKGPESIRVHPFFWGLSWETLESHTFTPTPHLVLCEERGNALRHDIANTFSTSLRHRQQIWAGSPETDAAASALDKIFDFSEW